MGQHRKSFVSGQDFQMSSNRGDIVFDQANLQTPDRLRFSRGTSVGHPDYEQVKNPELNDSISSNQTRPSGDRQIGRDGSAVMNAAPGLGMLSLIDNREVSPAPVSHFASKTRIGHNRVSLPFHKQGSLKASSSYEKLSCDDKLIVNKAASRNLKFS